MRYVTGCVAWLMAMSVLTALAGAQEILPGDLMRVTGPFANDQRQTVDAYVTHWASQLTGAQDAAQIAVARRKLMDPLMQAGATQPFKDQYSTLVGPQIGRGVSSDNYMVRLNTLIVIGNLTGGAGVDQMITGLHDENLAVRYWAAKAIAQSLGSAGASVTAQQRDSIQQAIGQMMGNEKSADVLEQMYDAMASLNTPASRQALVDAMNNRVAHFAANGLSTGLQAERTGLRRLYYVLVQAQLQGGANPAVVKNLAAACAKYLQLISNAVANQPIPEQLLAVTQEIVEVSQRTLNWAMTTFDANAKPGPELLDPFRNGPADKYAQFRFNVLQWTKLLQSSAIGLTADQLKL